MRCIPAVLIVTSTPRSGRSPQICGRFAEVCFENGDDFVIWLAGLEVSGMFGGYLQGFSKSLVRPDFLVFQPPSILQATLIKGRDP